MLRLTVSLSGCLGVESTLELLTRHYFLSESWCVVSMGCPLWREVRSVSCQWQSAVFSPLSKFNLICILHVTRVLCTYSIHKASGWTQSCCVYALKHKCNLSSLNESLSRFHDSGLLLSRHNMFHVFIYNNAHAIKQRLFCMTLMWKINYTNHVKEGFTTSILVFQLPFHLFFLISEENVLNWVFLGLEMY
jgi:hypothetical protein